MDNNNNTSGKQKALDIAEFERSLHAPKERCTTPVWAMINLLSTPIAKRKGVLISAEDCREWIKDLKAECEKYNIPERELI